MSRNLGDTSCKICNRDVWLCGDSHPITPAEAGRYFNEYEGMIVADALCRHCDAKYLAWVRAAPKKQVGHFKAYEGDQRPFVDLSFRYSFDDEPAPQDLPTPEMLLRVHLEQSSAHQARLLEEIQTKMAEAFKDLADSLSRPPYWEAYRR